MTGPGLAQQRITTVAGTGVPGSSGALMAATAATLAFTTSGAVDSSGNLYIADSGNDYVRKVDVRGDISRVAGTGAQGDSGDGGPAARAELQSAGRIRIDADGNLYIVDTDAGRVRKVTAFRTSSIAP